MVTIFSIPKPFQGPIRLIQENALKSWLRLQPTPEIILIGSDHGVADAAREFGVLHVPEVEKNEYGTPLLSSAFSLVQRISSHPIVLYANADVIFFQDLMETIKSLSNDKPFLISGRRWDLDIKEPIDFERLDWQQRLLENMRAEGRLHGLSGMDYFMFPRGTITMRPFAVGRPWWDAWLVFNMRQNRIPVIDATEAITLLHQNHDYSHSLFGRATRVDGPEFNENLRIAGGYTCVMSLRDADWLFDRRSLLKRPPFPRSIYPRLSLSLPWRLLLAAKRTVTTYGSPERCRSDVDRAEKTC